MSDSRVATRLWGASVLIVTLACAPGPVSAQTVSLATTFGGGSGHKGNMFDVEAIGPSPVTIRNLAQNFLGTGGSAADVRVYAVTGGGSYVPHQSNPAAWTLLASGTVVTRPEGTPTPLPFVLALTIPPGATTGLYVTCTTSTPANVSYSFGLPGTQGLPFVSDAHLRIRVGVGRSWPFGVTFSTRVWNGRMTYCPASTCPGDFETNSPDSSLAFDGIEGSPILPAIRELCPGAPFVFSSGSVHAGLGWETVITAGLPVSGFGPGLFTPGGQAINVDFLTAFVAWLFGGPAPSFVPHPGVFVAPASPPPGPITLSAQQIVFCPTHPDGYALSQACGLAVAPGGGVSGPTGDDTSLLVRPGDPPLCGPASIPFFGAAYTGFHVISNGRVVFGPPDTDFSPTVAEALAGGPFAGAWCDLAPNLGGTITTTIAPGGSVRVAWSGVPYFGNPGLPCAFAISLDPAAGAIALEGLGGFPVFPVTGGTTNAMFLGLSAGAPGATDPGPSVFTATPLVPGPAGLGMIYTFGQAGTLAPGVQTLTFIPNAAGNYDWSAL